MENKENLGYTIAGEESKEEETLEQRFDKMVKQLSQERGWSPRKSTRFLNCMSRRSVKQFRPKGNSKIRQLLKKYYVEPIKSKKQIDPSVLKNQLNVLEQEQMSLV